MTKKKNIREIILKAVYTNMYENYEIYYDFQLENYPLMLIETSFNNEKNVYRIVGYKRFRHE